MDREKESGNEMCAFLEQRPLRSGHARRGLGAWWSRVMTVACWMLAMMSLTHMRLGFTFLFLYFE